MAKTGRRIKNRFSTRLMAAVAVVVSACGFAVAFGAPALAQNFQWPWETQTRPVPREPVYRAPPSARPPPVYRDDGGYPVEGGNQWTARSPICLELERRLVQEGQAGSLSAQKLPAIREEIRKLDGQLHSAQAKLDNRGCYEYFLFTKTLRRTKSCTALARTVDTARRRLGELGSERQRLTGRNRQSRQDEIVRELARNGCGEAYSQQARRRDTSPFSGLWQDQDSGGGGYGNNYSRLPFATYRTLCVRLCDGYYFPVSFSTLPAHFERDAAKCQSKCVAPTELYFHQNPGAGVNDMVAFSSNQPYTQLKTAFRYRKEYVQGCSCKQAEFVPQSLAPRRQGAASPGGPPTPAEPPSPEAAPGPGETAEAPRMFDPTR